MADKSEGKLPASPGIYQQTLTLENGKLVRFTLSIPEKYSAKNSTPLVIALHYGGTVTPWYSEPFLKMLIEPGLRELHAIIVAPDCPEDGWNTPSSDEVVMQLMEFIKKSYLVDQKKILITGFSLGGIGTWYMIAQHPDIFSAAIPISSFADLEAQKLIKDSPIYAIHSDKDEIFPIEKVKEMIQLMKNREVPVKLVVVPGISHYHTAEFIKPLKESVTWLKAIWKK